MCGVLQRDRKELQNGRTTELGLLDIGVLGVVEARRDPKIAGGTSRGVLCIVVIVAETG